MPVTCTNRKGVTYILCKRTTAAGKLRYVFARAPHTPQGSQEPPADRGLPRDAVDTIPDGFTIRESVNGVVSLVRDVPPAFSAEEVAVLDAALRRHPKAVRYRVDVRGEHLVVYERLGPAADELASLLSGAGLAGASLTHVRTRLEAQLARSARYEPVLRFHLVDADTRRFGVERRYYGGATGMPGSDSWLLLGQAGSLSELARRVVPQLGTDAFFELW